MCLSRRSSCYKTRTRSWLGRLWKNCQRSFGKCSFCANEGLSYKEIADVVGIPLGTVMSGNVRLARRFTKATRHCELRFEPAHPILGPQPVWTSKLVRSTQNPQSRIRLPRGDLVHASAPRNSIGTTHYNEVAEKNVVADARRSESYGCASSWPSGGWSCSQGSELTTSGTQRPGRAENTRDGGERR